MPEAVTLDAPERPDSNVGVVGLLLHGATVSPLRLLVY